MSHPRFAALALVAGIPLFACASSTTDVGNAMPPPFENINASTTTPAQLHADLRSDFTREIQWTRLYATSAIAGLGDADASRARLLQSEDAIAATIAPLFGQSVADELTGLLHARLNAITSLVSNYRSQSSRSLGTHDELDANAQAIARFWARLVPTLWVRDLTSQLVTQNDALVDALDARATNDYPRSVIDFDRAESSALAFADTVSRAIAQKLGGDLAPSTIEPREEKLQLELRTLGDERVYWMRAYLVGRMAGNPVQPEIDRAVLTTIDMGRAYAAYYGEESGVVIQVHVHDELTDALAYYVALTSYDASTVDFISHQWNRHIATFTDDLVARDPRLDRGLVLRHLELGAFRTRSMIRARIEQRWADDIASYDDVVGSNDAFSDVLAHSVTEQFPSVM